VVNGANVEEIEPLTLAEARRRLGSMAPDVPVVGSLGQMYSDFSFLFETFAHIRAELPDCKLLLLGDLPRDISLDGIPPDSLWRPGYVPREELPLYLGACNLFLLPRRDILANRGRWPGKVGDYLAAARPVVTTAVGEIETIFRDTEGVVLTQVNAQAVAQEALALLLDRERAEELGKAAYRAAGEKLSWVEFTDRLEAFYDRILRGS